MPCEAMAHTSSLASIYSQVHVLCTSVLKSILYNMGLLTCNCRHLFGYHPLNTYMNPSFHLRLLPISSLVHQSYLGYTVSTLS
jgi:hypothetical protein